MNKIENILFTKVTEFIEKRYPIGWGGAAIMYTEDNCFLISVALENANASAGLCMETGAMCEAQKYNKKITHSLCVVRDDEKSSFKVLTPCGICQERLLYWGDMVQVGVTTKEGIIKFMPLKKINPYSWLATYQNEDLEHYSGSPYIE